MSSTSNSTDDENNSSSSSTQSSSLSGIVGFLTTEAVIVGVIIFYFVYGGIILYDCKIAQPNVLPHDINCEPYTEHQSKITPILTNIFIHSGEPDVSMKLQIPYKNNQKNTIIDLLRKYKSSTYSSNTGNFFAAIIDDLLSFNYSWLTNVLNLLNNLPEILILLLGPLIVNVVAVVMFIFEHFYFMYLWFANMDWFYKDKKNVTTQNKNGMTKVRATWDNMSFYELFDLYWAFVMVCIFTVLFFIMLIVFPFAIPIIPLFTMCWARISLLGYKGIINKNNTLIGVGTIIKNVFKYYKITFMVVLTILTALNALTKLGPVAGAAFALVVILMMFFGSVFKDKPEPDLTPLVSSDQADRVCVPKQKYGFFETAFRCLFGLQHGGKELVKDLKTVGKVIQQNSNISQPPIQTPTPTPIQTQPSPILPSNANTGTK